VLAVVVGVAVAFSEAAGACVDTAALLGGAVEDALGAVEGVCAQTGIAIARTAPMAMPLNRCFIFGLPTGPSTCAV
jgi:hypothetical protein